MMEVIGFNWLWLANNGPMKFTGWYTRLAYQWVAIELPANAQRVAIESAMSCHWRWTGNQLAPHWQGIGPWDKSGLGQWRKPLEGQWEGIHWQFIGPIKWCYMGRHQEPHCPSVCPSSVLMERWTFGGRIPQQRSCIFLPLRAGLALGKRDTRFVSSLFTRLFVMAYSRR